MGFPAHSNFERTDSPKIALTADKHSMGLSALSAHSVGRTAAVKAGGKPVHFSLDGCRLFCYFCRVSIHNIGPSWP